VDPASPTAALFVDPTPTPGGAAPTAVPATVAPAAAAERSGSGAPAASQSDTRPAAATGKPVRLVIDGINLDRTLVPVGLDANRLPIVPDHDIGWYTLGAQPGQGENVVLWGHVLRFRRTPNIPAPFARLKELKKGDVVALYDARGTTYRYVVTEQVWATPDQVEYMLPRGREQVTMISCIGDKVVADGSVEMSHRLITIAEPER
jgi:sortase (surface protein transpeptidase)